MKYRKHYKNVTVENWIPFQVFDWIAETATRYGLRYNSFNAKKYNWVDGRRLKEMTEAAFWDLTQSREAGSKMFEAKQNLFDSNNSIKRIQGRPRKKPKSDPEARDKPYGKIWEFIGKLLSNKETCPSLIKWDDYQAGMFKFVQPKKVAELWGLRKNNKQMNYNKFTRALRYHYKKGFLTAVEEKRLVYKFGPKAMELKNKFQSSFLTLEHNTE